MKFSKLSLAVAILACGACIASAADSLGEAFGNGNLGATIKATYADQTNENSAYRNEHIFATGIELRYVTDPLYGFKLGLSMQASGNPFSLEQNERRMFSRDWYADGLVLSEAYLKYLIGKTDVKAGRQYMQMPLVAGNYSRAFKESFEGVTISNKNIPKTEISGGWFYKFQGRTSHTATDKIGRAPHFKNKVVLGGYGPAAREFDNIYTVNVISKPIEELKLTGSYARVSDYDFAASYKETDVNLYLAELNFITPIMFDILKLGLDINYKGSKLNGEFEKMHYDGNMLGVRASIKDFEGLGLSYAYTTVSDGDELIFGVGFGPGSYTSLPIRGPFVYTGYAGMDTHKAALDYDFEKIGAKGLKANFQYSRGDQDAPKHRAGHTPAGQNSRIEGFSTGVKYAVASVKGLNFGVTYTSLNKKIYNSGVKHKDFDQNELWVQFSYKFDFSKDRLQY